MAATEVVFLRVAPELRERLGRLVLRAAINGRRDHRGRPPTVQSECVRLLASAVERELDAPEAPGDQVTLDEVLARQAEVTPEPVYAATIPTRTQATRRTLAELYFLGGELGVVTGRVSRRQSTPRDRMHAAWERGVTATQARSQAASGDVVLVQWSPDTTRLAVYERTMRGSVVVRMLDTGGQPGIPRTVPAVELVRVVARPIDSSREGRAVAL